MKIYILIELEDIYTATVVAAFTSDSKATEYGELWAKQKNINPEFWWIEGCELDPEFEEAE